VEPKKKLKTILARYKYHYYSHIKTKDVGTYAEMYEKYKGKYTFWCGDIPPQEDASGESVGYRLDIPDMQWTLAKWGKHKCWVDPKYKYKGKKVILVWNASLATVACVDCGFETKTVPKSKRCSKCESREFVYLREGKTERLMDFRSEKEIEDAETPTPYNHYDLNDT